MLPTQQKARARSPATLRVWRRAARGTSNSAQESQKAADELAELAVQLRGLVGKFKISGKSSATNPPTPKSRSAQAGA